MIGQLLFLLFGSVIAITIYLKENRKMYLFHQIEVLFLEQQIKEAKNKLKHSLNKENLEKKLYLKLKIIKEQVSILTIISNQNEQ